MNSESKPYDALQGGSLKNRPTFPVRILIAALRTALEHTQDLLFVKNMDLVYQSASLPFAKMLGLDDPSQIVGKTDFELFKDKDLARRYTEDDRRLIASGCSLENYIEPLPSVDGSPRWSSTSKYLIFDERGNAMGIYGVGRDVTNFNRALLDYKQELEYVMSLPEGSLCAVLLDMTDMRVERSSFRYPDKAPVEKNPPLDKFFEAMAVSVVDDEDVRSFFRNFTSSVVKDMYDQGKRGVSLEYLRVVEGKDSRWVRDDIRIIKAPMNNHLMAVFALSDIDEEKREQLALARSAEHDGMTGLLNHDATMRRIERFLMVEGIGSHHALFMIDVDNFKQINDTFGHIKGDEVISSVASSIAKVFRATDIVGRIGGDEFLALMKNAPSLSQIQQKACELLDALQYSCTVGDNTIALSGSVGVSFFYGENKSLSRLRSEADAALYRAKAAGKNCYSLAPKDNPDEAEPEQTPNAYSNSVQLRALLENMDGGVMLCDVDSDIRVTYISPSMFRTLGADKQVLGSHGEHMLRFVHPEDLPGLRAAIFRTAGGGGTLDYTYRECLPDAGVKWRHLRGVTLPSEGKARRIINVVTDISELKTREMELRLSEERHRLAVEMLGACVWELDIPARRALLSPAAQRRYGQTLFVDNVPESFFDEGRVHPDSVETAWKFYRSIFSGKHTGSAVLLERLANGEFGWSRYCFTLIYDEKGSPLRAVGTIEPMPDIQRERLLLAQEERLQSLLTDRLVITARVDLDSEIAEVHRRDSQPVVCSVPEFFSMGKALLVDEDGHRAFQQLTTEALKAAFARGDSWILTEFRMITPCGAVHWVSNTARLLWDPTTGHVIAFCYLQNIDRRKRWEMELFHDPERDTATFLYTLNTIRWMVDMMVRKKRDGLCGMVVLELEGLAELKKQRGLNSAGRALFFYGKLVWALVDTEMLAGRTDANRACVFLPDVSSNEETESFAASLLEQIENVHSIVGSSDCLNMKVSSATLPAANVSYDKLYSAAIKGL